MSLEIQKTNLIPSSTELNLRGRKAYSEGLSTSSNATAKTQKHSGTNLVLQLAQAARYKAGLAEAMLSRRDDFSEASSLQETSDSLRQLRAIYSRLDELAQSAGSQDGVNSGMQAEVHRLTQQINAIVSQISGSSSGTGNKTGSDIESEEVTSRTNPPLVIKAEDKKKANPDSAEVLKSTLIQTTTLSVDMSNSEATQATRDNLSSALSSLDDLDLRIQKQLARIAEQASRLFEPETTAQQTSQTVTEANASKMAENISRRLFETPAMAGIASASIPPFSRVNIVG